MIHKQFFVNKDYVYKMINKGLASSRIEKANTLYNALYSHFDNLSDDVFSRFVLPIARYVVESSQLQNVNKKAHDLSNFLKIYLKNDGQMYYYDISNEILNRYPTHKFPSDTDKMSVLACEFLNIERGFNAETTRAA